MKSRVLIPILTVAVVAACAVRLGGPDPVNYRTLALEVEGTPAPATVAEQVRSARAGVVFLSADADSAWFAAVAAESGLGLSGPGDAGETSLAFLGGPELLGDTTVALPVEGGDSLVVHDALYQIDENRYLDLLALPISSATGARDALHAFLEYVATDVMPNAAVILAVDVPDPAIGDSVSILLGPAFTDAATCMPEASVAGIASPAPAAGGTAAPAQAGMRIFYGPDLFIRCEQARVLQPGEPGAVVADLVVGR